MIVITDSVNAHLFFSSVANDDHFQIQVTHLPTNGIFKVILHPDQDSEYEYLASTSYGREIAFNLIDDKLIGEVTSDDSGDVIIGNPGDFVFDIILR